MLIDFFYTLRAAKLPVSVKEYLTLLEALQADVVGPKSRRRLGARRFLLPWRLHRPGQGRKHFDKFDRAFAPTSKGGDAGRLHQGDPGRLAAQGAGKRTDARAKAAIEKMGWDELMER